MLDTAELDEDSEYPTTYENTSVDVFLMAYGKLIYTPQFGVYYADEETHSLKIIEPHFQSLTGNIVPFENKLYINSYINSNVDDYHIKNVYDPITNTLEPTDIDANTDFDKGSTILNLYCDWCHYSSLKFEGETSGEHKIIFEWDTFDLPN